MLESFGYKVKRVRPGKMFGYAGMNRDAAKVMGWRKLASKTVEVDRGMSHRLQQETIKHEITEKQLMDRGLKYIPAHKVALHAERVPNDRFQTWLKKEVRRYALRNQRR